MYYSIGASVFIPNRRIFPRRIFVSIHFGRFDFCLYRSIFDGEFSTWKCPSRIAIQTTTDRSKYTFFFFYKTFSLLRGAVYVGKHRIYYTSRYTETVTQTDPQMCHCSLLIWNTYICGRGTARNHLLSRGKSLTSLPMLVYLFERSEIPYSKFSPFKLKVHGRNLLIHQFRLIENI